jgi:putative endonuclease
MAYYVYILASGKHGTLYIGVTNDLMRRVYEHRTDAVAGFTKKYGVHTLVYFEETESIESAIRREKRLKKWSRDWKLNLIERHNPEWVDLFPNLANQWVTNHLLVVTRLDRVTHTLRRLWIVRLRGQ